MSENQINKEAYKQAEKELLEGKIKEIKGYILKTLEKIENTKKEKENIEEKLRILKMDLEDLRNGKFDKIEERLEKSKMAREATAIESVYFNTSSPYLGSSIISLNNTETTSISPWLTYTGGVYNVNCSGIKKTFYF